MDRRNTSSHVAQEADGRNPYVSGWNWTASARRWNRSLTARSIRSAAGITAYFKNKPLKEFCACPDLSPDFRSAYRQLQSLSLVEMKDEGRAKSD